MWSGRTGNKHLGRLMFCQTWSLTDHNCTYFYGTDVKAGWVKKLITVFVKGLRSLSVCPCTMSDVWRFEPKYLDRLSTVRWCTLYTQEEKKLKNRMVLKVIDQLLIDDK